MDIFAKNAMNTRYLIIIGNLFYYYLVLYHFMENKNQLLKLNRFTLIFN